MASNCIKISLILPSHCHQHCHHHQRPAPAAQLLLLLLLPLLLDGSSSDTSSRLLPLPLRYARGSTTDTIHVSCRWHDKPATPCQHTYTHSITHTVPKPETTPSHMSLFIEGLQILFIHIFGDWSDLDKRLEGRADKHETVGALPCCWLLITG